MTKIQYKNLNTPLIFIMIKYNICFLPNLDNNKFRGVLMYDSCENTMFVLFIFVIDGIPVFN